MQSKLYGKKWMAYRLERGNIDILGLYLVARHFLSVLHFFTIIAMMQKVPVILSL